MRVVLQRVSRAAVRVDGAVVGSIGAGLALLVGFAPEDDDATLEWMADKAVGLRVFADGQGRMNVSLADLGGGALVVSQFTLYGDTSRGRRPGFSGAAPPELATDLYHRFVTLMEARAPGAVATGSFGAHMELELVNDGPVTLILDR